MTARKTVDIWRLLKGVSSDVSNNIIEVHENAAATVNDGFKEIEAALARLGRFQRTRRSKAASSSHQFNWIQEYRDLDKDANTVADSIWVLLSSAQSSAKAAHEIDLILSKKAKLRGRNLGRNACMEQVLTKEATPGKLILSQRKNTSLEHKSYEIFTSCSMLNEKLKTSEGEIKQQAALMLSDLKWALSTFKKYHVDECPGRSPDSAWDKDAYAEKSIFVTYCGNSHVNESRKTHMPKRRDVMGVSGPLLAELFLRAHKKLSEMDLSMENEYETLFCEVREARCKVMESLQSDDDGTYSSGSTPMPKVLLKVIDRLPHAVTEVSILRSQLASLFQEAQSEHEEAISAAKETFIMACPDCEADSWDDRSRTIFANILSQYDKSSFGDRKTRALDIMSMELAHKSTDDCLIHWAIVEQTRKRKRRDQESADRLKRKREYLVQYDLKQVNNLKSLLDEQATRSINSHISKAMRAEQRARLKLLRESRKQVVRNEADRQENEDAEKVKKEIEMNKKLTEQHRCKKEATRVYKDSKQRISKNKEVKECHQNYIAEMERLKQMTKNTGR